MREITSRALQLGNMRQNMAVNSKFIFLQRLWWRRDWRWWWIPIVNNNKNIKAIVVLVGGDVIDLHCAGEARVRYPGNHVDLVVVDGDAKEGAGLLHLGQVLPLKLPGVVRAHPFQALPGMEGRGTMFITNVLKVYRQKVSILKNLRPLPKATPPNPWHPR